MQDGMFELKSLIWRIIEVILCNTKWLFSTIFRRECDTLECLVGKTAIVTGGSSGIGLAVATLLASRGCRVIIADKDVSEEARKRIIDKTHNRDIVSKYIDLSSNTSIRGFVEDIKKSEKKIDILINNAGIGASSRKSSQDGNNFVMQVNYFGAFLLTHLLLEKLKASQDARIVFTASMLAFIHTLSLDNLNITGYQDDGSYPRILYSNSKLCNIMAAQGFARRLHEKFGISVFSIDPGTTRTPIYKEQGQELPGGRLRQLGLELLLLLFGTDTYRAADSAFFVSTQERSELKNGHHYFRCRPFSKPWICFDRKFCDEIWKKTEEIVQLKPEERIVIEL